MLDVQGRHPGSSNFVIFQSSTALSSETLGSLIRRATVLGAMCPQLLSNLAQVRVEDGQFDDSNPDPMRLSHGGC